MRLALLELEELQKHQKKPLQLDATGQWVEGRSQRRSVEAYLRHLKRMRERYARKREQVLMNRARYCSANRKDINRKSLERSKLETVKRKRNQRNAARYKTDVEFKIYTSIRTRINQVASGRRGKSIQIIGCSISEFRAHIERQFKEGMSWDNYGQWHLDHRIPCEMFDLLNQLQIQRCFNYLNYQPMWKNENIAKGCRLSRYEQIPLGLIFD